jgi:hypothetical protein
MAKICKTCGQEESHKMHTYPAITSSAHPFVDRDNVTDERLRAAREFWDRWIQSESGKVSLIFLADIKAGASEFAAQFAKEREDSAMREAAGLVAEICNRKEAGIIYNQDFSEACHDKALGEYIVKKIHERLAQKGRE